MQEFLESQRVRHNLVTTTTNNSVRKREVNTETGRRLVTKGDKQKSYKKSLDKHFLGCH